MPAGLELLADAGEGVVVHRLAREVQVGQRHAEGRVQLVEVDLGEVDELVPEPQGLGVTGLQEDDPRASPHVEVAGAAGRYGLLGGVELDAGSLVEGVRVGDEQTGLVRALPDVEQVLDEHAERRAPVADVVLADDVVPQVLESASDRVADDGRAQVPDVHLLGDVGRGVVDGDVLRRLERDASALVGLDLLQQPGDPGVGEGEVDEPRAADLDGVAHTVEVERGDDLGRDLAWRHTDLLGQRERGVDLHVGELRRTQHRVGLAEVVTEGGGDRGLDLGRERDERGDHAGSLFGPVGCPRHGFRRAPRAENAAPAPYGSGQGCGHVHVCTWPLGLL